MRIYRSQALTERWHILPADVRRFVESLRIDPQPDWALAVPERLGRYELPVGGYWIAWQIDESGGETTIAVWLIAEENE
jgi:hypothetical protein